VQVQVSVAGVLSIGYDITYNRAFCKVFVAFHNGSLKAPSVPYIISSLILEVFMKKLALTGLALVLVMTAAFARGSDQRNGGPGSADNYIVNLLKNSQ
jgi:hypothetical protein